MLGEVTIEMIENAFLPAREIVDPERFAGGRRRTVSCLLPSRRSGLQNLIGRFENPLCAPLRNRFHVSSLYCQQPTPLPRFHSTHRRRTGRFFLATVLSAVCVCGDLVGRVRAGG